MKTLAPYIRSGCRIVAFVAFLLASACPSSAGIFNIDDFPSIPKDPTCLTATVTGQKGSLDAAEKRLGVSPGVTASRGILADLTEKYDTVKNTLSKQFNNAHTAVLFARDIAEAVRMATKIVNDEIAMTDLFLDNVTRHPLLALQYYKAQHTATVYLGQLRCTIAMFGATTIVGYSSTAKQNRAILSDALYKMRALHLSLRSDMMAMRMIIHGWDNTDRMLRLFEGNEGRQIALNVIANF